MTFQYRLTNPPSASASRPNCPPLTESRPPLLPAPEPLMTLGDARRELAAFHLTERQLRERIDCLEIPWTWNIASPDATRSTLRLLPADVRALRLCLEEGRTAGTDAPRAFAEVCALVLPGPGPAFYGTADVAGLLSCSQMHVLHLLQLGELRAYGGSRPRPGRTHGARISVVGLESFLQTRLHVRPVALSAD